MARIAKPEQSRLRAGNPGHRRVGVTRMPKGKPAVDLRVPDWLRDPEAKAIWLRVAPALFKIRLLAPTEADTFARYCYHFAAWLRACRAIDEAGEVIETPMTGHTDDAPKMMLRRNPQCAIRDNHESALISFEDRFGGNPLARFRLRAQQAARPGLDRDLFGESDPVPDPAAAIDTAAQPSTDQDTAFGFLGRAH